MTDRKVEPVPRVERVSDGKTLEEGRCWACGAEVRAACCSARCALSEAERQKTRGGSVIRYDSEE